MPKLNEKERKELRAEFRRRRRQKEYLIKVTETRTIDLTVQAPSKVEAEKLARAASANDYDPIDGVAVDDELVEITTVKFFDRVDE